MRNFWWISTESHCLVEIFGIQKVKMSEPQFRTIRRVLSNRLAKCTIKDPVGFMMSDH